jgi:hypothetical protein
VGNPNRNIYWKFPPTRAVSTLNPAEPSALAIEEESMDAYHIDRFGSVDGIVLRSSEDPGQGRKRS